MFDLTPFIPVNDERKCLRCINIINGYAIVTNGKYMLACRTDEPDQTHEDLRVTTRNYMDKLRQDAEITARNGGGTPWHYPQETQENKCPDCKGVGLVYEAANCSTCDGVGELKCHECGSFYDCPDCDEGVLIYGSAKCSKCGGKKTITVTADYHIPGEKMFCIPSQSVDILNALPGVRIYPMTWHDLWLIDISFDGGVGVMSLKRIEKD